MSLTLKDIFRQLDSGQFAPVYFLHGDEPYFIDELLPRFRRTVVDEATADFNYDCFYGEEADGDQVAQAANSFPMMADRRLVVVRQVQKLSTSGKNRLLHYLENPSESTCLVLTANRVDKRQKFYSRLLKAATCFESKPLYENQAGAWLIQHLQAQGLRISPQAAGLLVQQSGTSLWALRTEADKLLAAAGDATALDDGAVAELAGYSRSYNLWEFSDRVGKRDLSGALDVLIHMMREGQSAVGLVIELHRRFLLLLRIRAIMDQGGGEAQIASTLGLKPYFVRLYLAQAKAYPKDVLMQGLDKLLAADVFLKTGRMDDVQTMVLLIHELIRGGRRPRSRDLFYLAS